MKKGAKILLVEDEALIRWSVATSFMKAGLAVEHVQTGEEAIAKIREKQFDLVLTDLKLPEIDGFEVAARTKSVSPSIPVIIMSALDERTFYSAYPHGIIDYYIEKPFNLDDVLRIVLLFLEGGKDIKNIGNRDKKTTN